jgi:hypothetical protein
MAGDIKDLRITTMQAVTRVLVNGSWGQYPCALVADTEKEIVVDNPVIVAQCQHLQNMLTNLSEEYKNEVAQIREDDRKKIEFLKEQIGFKDREIKFLQSIIEKKTNSVT